jgi:hypothetical protein
VEVGWESTPVAWTSGWTWSLGNESCCRKRFVELSSEPLAPPDLSQTLERWGSSRREGLPASEESVRVGRLQKYCSGYFVSPRDGKVDAGMWVLERMREK